MCVDGGMGSDATGDGYVAISGARGASIRRDVGTRSFHLAGDRSAAVGPSAGLRDRSDLFARSLGLPGRQGLHQL